MAEEKKSFVVYCDLKEILNELSDEEAGILFKAMVNYAQNGVEPELGIPLKYVWIPIRQQMERDAEKWNEVKKVRSAAGRKGGVKSGQVRAKKSEKSTKVIQNSEKRVTKTKQTKQSQANEAVNVNVNDNVNVNVNDNVIQFVDDLLRPLEGAVDTSYSRDKEEIIGLVAKRLDEGHTEQEMRDVVQYKLMEMKSQPDIDSKAFVEMFSNPLRLFGDAYEGTVEDMNKYRAHQESMERLTEIEEETE